MEFYAEPHDPKRFKCSIRLIFQMIHNQKWHPNCLAHVLTDLVTYVYRILGLWVDLSPQPVVDAGIVNFKYAKPFLTDPKKGLQSKNDYKFERIRQYENDPLYQLGNHHTLDDLLIITESDNIKKAILENFGKFGQKFPIAANIKGKYLRELRLHPTKAKDAFNGAPFKVDRTEGFTDDLGSHAILITGVDVTAENEELHSVEWRNSWGGKWGEEGYTKVTFDFFDEATIFVPVLDVKNRSQIHRFCITTLISHKYDIKDMCFSACGNLLTTASEDGIRIINLRDPSSKHINCAHLKMPDGSPPNTLCFDENFSIIVATESETKASLCMLGGDDSNKKICCIKWRKDKDALPRKQSIAKLLRGTLNGTTFLVTSTQASKIRIWHGQDYGKELLGGRHVKNNIMAISPNGHYIVAATTHDIVRVWVLRDGKNSPTKGESSQQAQEDLTVEPAFSLKGHKADITSLCFTSDSQRIIGASEDGSLKVWDINDPGSHSEILDLDPTVSIEYTQQDYTSIQYYEHISISPNGKLLAVAGASLLRWICVESMEILETIGRAHNGNITCINWAPVPVCVGNKKVYVLATAGADKLVKLWAAPTLWEAPSI